MHLLLDYQFIYNAKKRYQDLDIPLYNIFNLNDAKEIADNIIRKLSEYSEIDVV